MELIKKNILFLILVFLFFGCSKNNSSAINDFYEAQFQCNRNADRFIAKEADGPLRKDIWTVISDFKIKEMSPNSEIKSPHKRFKVHYVAWAAFSCAGGMLNGPQNSNEIKTINKDRNRDAILLMYIDDKGRGVSTRLDYKEMSKEGMNFDEDGHSFLNFAAEGTELPNCVSKVEELISGKAKIELQKLCSYMTNRSKADVERFMSYWKTGK